MLLKFFAGGGGQHQNFGLPFWISVALWAAYVMYQTVEGAIPKDANLEEADTKGKTFLDEEAPKQLMRYVCPKLRRGVRPPPFVAKEEHGGPERRSPE